MKGSSQASRSIIKHIVHQDSWVLKIAPLPTSDRIQIEAPIVRWERRKKPANGPNPARAGATQAYHKGRGILFGGVHDVEESEEGLESEFFDGMFAFNLERNRFFPLTLRRNKRPFKSHDDDRGPKRARGKADEAELLQNLAALETGASIADAKFVDAGPATEEENEPSKAAKVVLSVMPHPRFNALLTVQDDVVYIFGGTFEHGNREYTFDEMYAIDLVKLDGVREIYRRAIENWLTDESEDNSESGEDESEDQNTDDENMGVALPVASDEPNAMDTVMLSEPEQVPSETATVDALDSLETVPLDTRPHPRPFENLRDFYARTSVQWQDFVIATSHDSAENRSVKELRTSAFEQAERKWWDCREEIMTEEERQEEAGIGEIISLADRPNDVGSLGKRR